ncbi:hypothetical protein F4861DRAFT_474584 [Xylaria intraflava]|nr:hypothetical protein F4861DRAFT_474584 [Xylaria intraflava]
MDISSLQVPKAGRSRFSKALPVPPDPADQPRAPSRELPEMPPAPPPPKKNSVLIGSISTPNLRAKGFDSPLPTLPIMAEPGRMRARAGPIARKPVALPSMPSVLAGTNTATDVKPDELKREASISSLLSAYSRSSSDSAQMSSHESDLTKDSEPSYSPEREGMISNIPPILPKKSMETTNSINGDSTSEVTSYTIIDSFPPPPPKNLSRPRTPSNGRTIDGAQDKKAGLTSLSPISVGSGNSSPHEIRRRRASSKSDASLVVADLKLPGSNGSTASTHSSGGKILQHSLPPLPPAKPNQQIALPPPPNPTKPSAVTLPPRTASLSGRTPRPIKQAEPFDEDQQKMKLPGLSKIKELVRHGRDNDSDEGQKSSQNTDSQRELPESRDESVAKVQPEVQKPEPPAKDSLTYQPAQPQHEPANATLVNPVPPPKETREPTSVVEALPRHPLGELPTLDLGQPKLDLKIGLEKISESEPNSRQDSSTAHQSEHPQSPSNPKVSVPHPSQKQQTSPPPQILSSRPSYAQNGPASATGESRNRSVSTSAGESQSTASSIGTLPGAASIGSPHYQPRIAKSGSPEIGEIINKTYNAPPRTSSAVGPFRAFLPRSEGLEDVREDATEDSGGDGELQEGPMSAEAMAAVALFPRKQDWQSTCTVDGVWLPSALTQQHHGCHANHYQLISARNTQYPLACQTCGIADTMRRVVCPHCNLRICVPCADLLVANRRDLRATLAVLAQQGKIREWDAYPKRGADQGA